MPIEFYDVKTRKKVSLGDNQVKKVTYQPKGSGGPRYAVRGEHEGRKLTKFVSKADYDKLTCPEEKA